MVHWVVGLVKGKVELRPFLLLVVCSVFIRNLNFLEFVLQIITNFELLLRSVSLDLASACDVLKVLEAYVQFVELGAVRV